jgi:hypothetical protein
LKVNELISKKSVGDGIRLLLDLSLGEPGNAKAAEVPYRIWAREDLCQTF